MGGVKEAYAIVGRRGGKSRMIGTAGTFIACFGHCSGMLSTIGERNPFSSFGSRSGGRLSVGIPIDGVASYGGRY